MQRQARPPLRVPAAVLLLAPPLVLAVLVQVLAALLDLDMVATKIFPSIPTH